MSNPHRNKKTGRYKKAPLPNPEPIEESIAERVARFKNFDVERDLIADSFASMCSGAISAEEYTVMYYDYEDRMEHLQYWVGEKNEEIRQREEQGYCSSSRLGDIQKEIMLARQMLHQARRSLEEASVTIALENFAGGIESYCEAIDPLIYKKEHHNTEISSLAYGRPEFWLYKEFRKLLNGN